MLQCFGPGGLVRTGSTLHIIKHLQCRGAGQVLQCRVVGGTLVATGGTLHFGKRLCCVRVRQRLQWNGQETFVRNRHLRLSRVVVQQTTLHISEHLHCREAGQVLQCIGRRHSVHNRQHVAHHIAICSGSSLSSKIASLLCNNQQALAMQGGWTSVAVAVTGGAGSHQATYNKPFVTSQRVH